MSSRRALISDVQSFPLEWQESIHNHIDARASEYYVLFNSCLGLVSKLDTFKAATRKPTVINDFPSTLYSNGVFVYNHKGWKRRRGCLPREKWQSTPDSWYFVWDQSTIGPSLDSLNRVSYLWNDRGVPTRRKYVANVDISISYFTFSHNCNDMISVC